MKTRLLISMMGLTALLFALTALPYGCSNTDNQNTGKTEPEQEMQDTAGTVSTAAQPIADENSGTQGIRSDLTEDQPVAVVENTVQQNEAKAKQPTAEKATPPKTENKPAVKVPEPKKTEPAPKPAPQPVVNKTPEPVNNPAPPVKTEPAAPKPAPETTAPKTETAPTTTTEPKQPAPEVKKEEPKPAPPKAVQQPSKWPVPESANNKSNPVKADNASLKAGKTLYNKHCASCHGKSGLGDGTKAAQLDTPSGDFSSAGFQNQTDGSLFYKTVQGRDDMPGYKKKIPDEEDIWNLVNYMRTFK
ncbi:MAG: c-type cytochrome [Saprospiraceae bacterium]|nr:c-type cytochrome [Saprospiraceae bacterium]MCF8252170.1 c-type cytochrome [Saprospiraceae bacterium]MCF8281577.1 c-type cytochrome [Bacteroidales bacterium]MCF8313839.1 c-type cytochrome [Saprospiraceae bacterium]MCF8442569.1 c-type cytochrome [Saprospiraceae bacterium]